MLIMLLLILFTLLLCWSSLTLSIALSSPTARPIKWGHPCRSSICLCLFFSSALRGMIRPSWFLNYLLWFACLILDLLGEVGVVVSSGQRHDWHQFHWQWLLMWRCWVTLILMSLGSSLTLGVVHCLLLRLVSEVLLLGSTILYRLVFLVATFIFLILMLSLLRMRW